MIHHITTTNIPHSIAPGEDIIAIGDVHGCDGLFEELIQHAATIQPAPGKTRTNIVTGDLIDRGPNSLRCIDLAMSFANVALMGNHEQMLCNFLVDHDNNAGQAAGGLWFVNGGHSVVEELAKRDGRWSGKYPDFDVVHTLFAPEQVAWLLAMKNHFVSGGVMFVHAGLNPMVPLADFLNKPWRTDFEHFGKKHEAVHWAWVRGPFLTHIPDENGHHGHFVVHGHTTPIDDPISINEQIRRSRINVDGGSYNTDRVRMVHLRDNLLSVYEAHH